MNKARLLSDDIAQGYVDRGVDSATQVSTLAIPPQAMATITGLDHWALKRMNGHPTHISSLLASS